MESPWVARPDPPPTPVTYKAGKISIPLPAHVDLRLPNGPSHFILGKANDFQRELWQVFDLRTGKPIGKPVLQRLEYDRRSEAFSPDGRYLAAMRRDPETHEFVISVWSFATGEMTHALRMPGLHLSGPLCFAAPHQLVTLHDPDGQVSLLHAVEPADWLEDSRGVGAARDVQEPAATRIARGQSRRPLCDTGHGQAIGRHRFDDRPAGRSHPVAQRAVGRGWRRVLARRRGAGGAHAHVPQPPAADVRFCNGPNYARPRLSREVAELLVRRTGARLAARQERPRLRRSPAAGAQHGRGGVGLSDDRRQPAARRSRRRRFSCC